MDSVDTGIDLRNVRMRFLFFETFLHPEATITGRVTAEMLEGLADLRRKTLFVPVEIDLHGVKKAMEVEVVATMITDNTVSIASIIPVTFKVDDFNLLANLAKLEDAASVDILPLATVTFDFVFNKNTQADETSPQIAAADPSDTAMETDGDFDMAACEGRFEILSRTGNIYFNSGSATLDTASHPLLETLADVVARCPDLQVEVAGHTDSDGSATTNKRLSEARARAVAGFLVNAGIEGDRLIARGYGETVPVVPNTSAENKRRNRRIEFAVLKN